MTTPNLRCLYLEQCDLSNLSTSHEAWRKLFTKLKKLSVLRLKKVNVPSLRCFQDLSGFLTGLQLSYQQHVWSPELLDDYLGQLPLTCHNLTWLDFTGTKVGADELERIVKRLGGQLTGIGVLADGKTLSILYSWLAEVDCVLTSLGLQVQSTSVLINSRFEKLKNTYLNEMDIRKPLVVSILQSSEEQRL
jgi:hypothetical protein